MIKTQSIQLQLVYIFLLFFSSFSIANETTPTTVNFTPHISFNATTRPQWSLSLGRSAGANLNTNFLLSALTFSVLDRLEVGTVVAFYGQSSHKYNWNVKYNFYRGDEVQWAIGYSHVRFKVDNVGLSPSLQNKDLEFGISSILIATNYKPSFVGLKLGVFYNTITQKLENADALTEIYSYEAKHEFGIDISHPYKKNIDITIGAGWLRDSGLSANEEVNFGFGPSVRYYRPKKLFSSPTVGLHYTPDTNKFQYLFSTSIY